MLKAKLNEDKKTIYEVIDYEIKLSQIDKDYKLSLIENSVDDETINAILSKAENKRTVSDLRKIVLRQNIDSAYKSNKENLETDYLEFQADDFRSLELGEYDEIETYVEVKDNIVHQRFKIVKNTTRKLNAAIESLKERLSSTDYIIIKAYEAKVMMQDSPYSDEFMTKTTEERQKIRDEINRLEELLKTVK